MDSEHRTRRTAGKTGGQSIRIKYRHTSNNFLIRLKSYSVRLHLR